MGKLENSSTDRIDEGKNATVSTKMPLEHSEEIRRRLAKIDALISPKEDEKGLDDHPLERLGVFL